MTSNGDIAGSASTCASLPDRFWLYVMLRHFSCNLFNTAILPHNTGAPPFYLFEIVL